MSRVEKGESLGRRHVNVAVWLKDCMWFVSREPLCLEKAGLCFFFLLFQGIPYCFFCEPKGKGFQINIFKLSGSQGFQP